MCCEAEVRSHNPNPVSCVSLKAHLSQRLIRKRHVRVLCRLLTSHHRRSQVQNQLRLIVPAHVRVNLLTINVKFSQNP